MSKERDPTDAGPDPAADQPHERRRPHSRPLRLGLAAAALVALGAVAATALQASAHGGRGWHRQHSALDVDSVRERAVDRAEWVLDAVDATPDQREDVNAILGDLVTTLHPYIEQHRERRREFVDELMRPAPDADALERVRAQEIALFDEVSREAVAALAQVASALTPEQRAELAERADRFRRH